MQTEHAFADVAVRSRSRYVLASPPTKTFNSIKAIDRLLNWAVATTLTDDLVAARRSVEEVSELLKGYNSGAARPGGRNLGYVPMDVVWLMSKSRDLCEHLPAVIPALEEHHVQTEDLYTMLLPTVGHTVVGALAKLLEERDFMLYAQRPIIEGLCRLGGEGGHRQSA